MSKDAAFCFWCYLFKPINANSFGDDVFVKVGFNNWKKALDKFNEHVGEVNSIHNVARISYENFKNQNKVSLIVTRDMSSLKKLLIAFV